MTTPTSAIAMPTLWVAGSTAVISLARYGHFQVCDLFNPRSEFAPGLHWILVDSTTPEAVVRYAIYLIKRSGEQPKIYQCQQHVSVWAGNEAMGTRELLKQINEYSINSSDWLKSRYEQKISATDARDIAAVVLRYDHNWKVELEELRTRCGASSWDWKGIIEELSQTVTSDSNNSGDSCNSVRMDITATVTTVTDTLQSGLTDYEECQRLEEIQANSVVGKNPFSRLVSAVKTRIDEVQPEDEIRLQNLINWHNAEIDFNLALPSMADDLIHDAAVLNIEPIGLWQPLLAATTSLIGKRVKLDVASHTVPAIAFTCTIAESGAGKTRAEKVILSPLKKSQIQERERFEAQLKEYENWDNNGEQPKPEKPKEKKYMFEVATIQAVIKRLGEQGENGSLWARDELAGLFKSFGQFSKGGDNEGLECLLKLWDGDPAQVDRVSQSDSFIIGETALSITGNIQPGAYRKAFKDPDDAQGLQARFLYALLQTRKPKRVKGYCQLADKLPDLYEWLQNCPIGTIKLSKQADNYYDKLYEIIGEQASSTSMPAIRAWMFKLPTHLLRVALALHVLECYHDPTRNYWELQKDTLERAVLFAQYYRSVFHVVQEKTADSDDISSILLKIWDAAITKHPDGISTRDAYRSIKAIQYRAKDSRRDISAYTADLFFKLQSMGKGQVIKSGRQIKFVANLSPIDVKLIEETELKISDIGDSVTEAETPPQQAIQVSPQNDCHPVTVVSDETLPKDDVKLIPTSPPNTPELVDSEVAAPLSATTITPETNPGYTVTNRAEEAPTPPSHDFTKGNMVEVLGDHELKGKRLVVSTVDHSGIWLREQKSGFNPPYKEPFQPHQLRKC